MSLNTCQQCNATLPGSASFCSNCGKPIDEVSTAPTPPPVQQTSLVDPPPTAAETAQAVLLMRQLNQPWYKDLWGTVKDLSYGVIGFFVIVFVIAVCVNIFSGPSEEEKRACDAVWKKFIEGMGKSTEAFTDNSNKDSLDPWTRAHRVKVAFYRNVDVSQCPSEFRIAWTNYVAALAKENPVDYFKMIGDGDVTLDNLADKLETMRPLKEAEKQLTEAFKKFSPLAKHDMEKYGDK